MTSTVQNRGRISGIRLQATAAVVAFAIATLSALVAVPAQAQTYRVLHSFSGGKKDGENPYSGLVRDAQGNFYGTTFQGGVSNNGTVFKLNKAGKETGLYSFTGYPSDGALPTAGLVRDAAGNLYGTTQEGGSDGFGTVFKLDTTGKETVLYSFTGSTQGDGAYPEAGVIRDAAGNLFGTTSEGGAFNLGAVFKVDATGKETVLYSFSGPPTDGASPAAGLTQDATGNLYGTTWQGGASSYGAVFELDTTGTEKMLYSFLGFPIDGASPTAGLVRDAAGNLYGTTQSGGSDNYGTVFKLDTMGKESVLHSFAGMGSGDGATPKFGPMVRDRNGSLYGTTSSGGVHNNGTVFQLDTAGKERILHSFAGGTDGSQPYAGLIRDAKGRLYGTTNQGGKYGCCKGLVFRIQVAPSATVP